MYNVEIINDIQNMTLQAMFDVPWNNTMGCCYSFYHKRDNQ